jgi:hypothetical protein
MKVSTALRAVRASNSRPSGQWSDDDYGVRKGPTANWLFIIQARRCADGLLEKELVEYGARWRPDANFIGRLSRGREPTRGYFRCAPLSLL